MLFIRIVFCYARQDEQLRDELEQHLGTLKRSGKIVTWHDRKILPGTDWSQEIDRSLRLSEVILLLVSPHFLASDYCYGVEMQTALVQHQAGKAIPYRVLALPHFACSFTLPSKPSDVRVGSRSGHTLSA